MKKPRFKIGEWVRAKQTVKFITSLANNKLISLQPGVNGVVVGATTRYLGIIDARGFDDASLINRQSVQVWQIRQGYLNKPHEALDEDVVSLENNLDENDNTILLKSDIPFKYNSEWHGVNGYQNRAAISFDSQDFERDEMGRFV